MQNERQLTLDGIRGLAATAVVFSHYFAEVEGTGIPFTPGHLGVSVFFVLSGFLIGRLILTRRDSENFFKVFYVRRVLRTFPSYFLVVSAVLLLAAVSPALVGHGGRELPDWSYFLFLQNVMMMDAQSVGLESLAPTWTLAVEEQFYLVAPALIVFLSRRAIVFTAAGIFLLSTVYRIAMGMAGFEVVEYMPSLIARADLLSAGILGALIWFKIKGTRRFDKALEITPLACTIGILVIGFLEPTNWERTWLQTLVAIGATAFILRAAVNQEANRYLEARWLRFMGDNSYSIYLIHTPVAYVLHRVLLDAYPGIGSLAALAVTFVAIAVTLGLGRLITWGIEEPLTALGRRFRWKARPADATNAIAPAPAV